MSDLHLDRIMLDLEGNTKPSLSCGTITVIFHFIKLISINRNKKMTVTRYVSVE